MTVGVITLTVSGVAAVLTALYYVMRKVLRGTETLLLDLIPVIQALGQVRGAWQQARSSAAVADQEEGEGPRALP
jgi:hypothetical protein